MSHQIASLVQNISVSTKAQTKLAADITENMRILRHIASKTTESSASTSSAIGKLSELASQLRKTVSGFTLPDFATGTGVISHAKAAQSIEREAQALLAAEAAPPRDPGRRRRSG